MEKSKLCKMWLTWGLRTSRPPDILVDFVKVSTQTAFQLCHMEGRDRFFCRKLVYQHVQIFCSRFIFLCENILVKNGIWRTPYRERCSKRILDQIKKRIRIRIKASVAYLQYNFYCRNKA